MKCRHPMTLLEDKLKDKIETKYQMDKGSILTIRDGIELSISCKSAETARLLESKLKEDIRFFSSESSRVLIPAGQKQLFISLMESPEETDSTGFFYNTRFGN